MKKIFTSKSLLIIGFIGAIIFLGRDTGMAQTTGNLATVTVTVTDSRGPILGASVMVKETWQGSSTDNNGVARLTNVSSTAMLEVSFIGYVTQEIAVAGRTSISVVLVEEAQQVDEVIVVGYGTQRKESVTSAITSIGSDEIMNTKQADVVTSLQGKVPGLMIRQSGGLPGQFYSDLSIRGFGTPIVVIDGIVRSEAYTNSSGYGVSTDLALAQLNPDDIESITVLKDASASIYGLGAGNGVILVTTKKGNNSTKPSINYSNTFTFGSPKMPKEMNMVDLMMVANEMADNAHYVRPYEESTIDEYRNGTKKGFSWWDIMMKDFSFSQTHNLSIRGGGERVNYFISAGYTDDNSIYRVKDNFTYERFTLRGNFTAKLTDHLSLDYQTSIRATQSKNPYNTDSYGGTAEMLFNYIAYSDRTVGATTLDNPNHYTYQGAAPAYNPMAIADHDLNYTDKRGRLFTNNLTFRYNAPFLKGLVLQATGAYDFNYNGTYNKQTVYPLYDYYTDEQMGTGGAKNSYGESITENERYYGRFQANYDFVKNNHRLSATVAAEATKTNLRRMGASREFEDFFTHSTISSGIASTAAAEGTRSETATAGYLARVNYDFGGRYLVEVMGRYDATYIYAPGERWGFFPSYSLGWRISEEKFIKDNLPWITNLKVRWSDGKTGLTQGSAYAYQSGYTTSGSYIFDSGSSTTGYVNSQIANTILTWADIRLMDFGVDWDFWGGMFGGTFDVFKRKTTGIAGTSSGSTPTILGVSVPQINIDSRMNVGLELSLSHRNKIGDLSYSVSVTGTYSRTKNLHVESQASQLWSSQMQYYGEGLFNGGSRINRWANYRALWYYRNDGQFGDWSDINSSGVKYDPANGMQTTVPGSIKLKDMNGDGYITGQDIRYKWGEANPALQYGLTLNAQYKNWDFSTVWQGATLSSKIIWLLHIFGPGGYENNYEMYLDRWRVQNYGDDPYDPNTKWKSGYWPALVDANGPNNLRAGTYDFPNDYTQKNATYFRMKSIEVGYTIPKNILAKVGLSSARVYAGGTNLLTICNKVIKYYDPESAAAMHGSTMPVMRTIYFGLNLNF